jgi:hypothetical protein
MSNDWAGVWIDQRNAFIVRPTEADCEVTTVLSEMEAYRKSSGGKGKSRPYMHENAPSSVSHRSRSDENKMRKYLGRVASQLAEANRILLLGPGKTKDHLRSLIVASESELRHPEISLEAADRLTEAQIKATVREHFGDL